MKPQFHEAWQNKKSDPLNSRNSTEFDFDHIDDLLDGESPEVQADVRALTAQALKIVLTWVVSGHLDAKRIGRRAIALAWCSCPDLFNGLSQAELAKQLGHTKPLLSVHCSEFTRAFGVKNRAQSHGDGNRKTQPVVGK